MGEEEKIQLKKVIGFYVKWWDVQLNMDICKVCIVAAPPKRFWIVYIQQSHTFT